MLTVHDGSNNTTEDLYNFRERRRSSLGLSSLFTDHMVPQLSLDSMLCETTVRDSTHQLASHAVTATPVADDIDTFGAVPCLTDSTGAGPMAFFSHEVDPRMMLVDVKLSDPVDDKVSDGLAKARSNTYDSTHSMNVLKLGTISEFTGQTSEQDLKSIAQKQISDTCRENTGAPLSNTLSLSSSDSSAVAIASASSLTSKGSVLLDACTSSLMDTQPSCSSREITKSDFGKNVSARSGTAVKTRMTHKAGSVAKVVISKRSKRDAGKCATVLAAMPKPPRRNRNRNGKTSRLDELTKHMTPERARLEKNRQSARECRIRKKEYVGNLEKKISEFEERDARRVTEIQDLKRKIVLLQKQLQGTSG